MVGLSFMTPQYSRAAAILGALQSRLPHALYFAGGPHPSALPEETLTDLGLDFVVVGEGEFTTMEVAASGGRRETLETIRGIVFTQGDGQLSRTPRRGPITDLDALPLPARELLDQRWYMSPPGFIRGEWLDRPATVIMSRGCPSSCTFCGARLVHGKRVRYRSVENVIAELVHLKETYGVDGFWVLDDTFTLNPSWVQELCASLIKEGLRFKWGTQTRVDVLDLPTLEALREAGCVQLDFGVESGSLRVLRRLKKATRPEQVKNALSLARKAGLRRMTSFMVGNPGETMEDLEATLLFAKEISPDYVLVTYTTPYPGSEMYAEARAKGWIDDALPFGQAWNLDNFRQPPVMEASLPKQTLVTFRRRFQNSFWWTNYSLYFKQPAFLRQAITAVLGQPLGFIRAVGLLIRSRNIDGFFGDIKALYRSWAWDSSRTARKK
jgi:anaerobic magnesium-protoporphyrin IX monomethyl ester cyclase